LLLGLESDTCADVGRFISIHLEGIENFVELLDEDQ
jgi:hypothetical protein